MTDKQIALENIELFERLKEKIPSINTSLTKNIDRITKLIKTPASDDRLKPFIESGAGSKEENIASDRAKFEALKEMRPPQELQAAA